jgi:hypothetical protein
MYFRIGLFLLASGVLAKGSEFSRPIRKPLEEIRHNISRDGLPCLEGRIHGYPGGSGAYFLNFPRIQALANRHDIEAMLRDSNPVIRLVGAKIAIGTGVDNSAVRALSTDSSEVWVGPLYDGGDQFRRMKVSEVMIEIRNDPLFELRSESGASVHVDSIVGLADQNGATVILGKLPEYPYEMARAGVTGDITVRLEFKSNSKRPMIHVLRASQRELEGPTIWALSKWELTTNLPQRESITKAKEFECHLVFSYEE